MVSIRSAHHIKVIEENIFFCKSKIIYWKANIIRNFLISKLHKNTYSFDIFPQYFSFWQMLFNFRAQLYVETSTHTYYKCSAWGLMWTPVVWKGLICYWMFIQQQHHSGTTALGASGQQNTSAAWSQLAGCLHETSKIFSSGGGTISFSTSPTAIT